jgi:hypothetical protein
MKQFLRLKLMLMLALTSAAGVWAGRAAVVPAYDWVLTEKIRAGYLGSKDPADSAARMKAAGQNTVVLKLGSLGQPPLTNELAVLTAWAENTRAAKVRLIWGINFAGGAEKFTGTRRMMTGAGEPLTQTPCPLDATYWQRNVESRFLYLAEKSKDLNVTGAVVDPEMYAADIKMYRAPCYCDECLREFIRSEGGALEAGAVFPRDRVQWLKQGQAGARFDAFFQSRVRGICRAIEGRVHARNPDFMIGLLQSFADVPFFAAVQDGLGTPERPSLGFSEETYNHGFTPYITSQLRQFEASRISVFYVPGIWVNKFPTENLAEQFFACAQATAGYWVYSMEFLVKDVSNHPKYALPEPVERYWAALTEANRELDHLQRKGGAHATHLRVREFKPPPPLVVVADYKAGGMSAITVNRKDASEQAPTLRYRGGMNILGQKGVPVRIRLVTRRLSTEDKIWFGVMGPDGQKLFQGAVDPGTSQDVQWMPSADGVYGFVADAGQNTLQMLVTSGQPYGFRATRLQPLRCNGALGRLHFYVPVGTTKTSICLKAAGHRPGRGAKVSVFSPDGEVAARFSGDLGSVGELPVGFPREMQGKVWMLTAEDVTNDLMVYFDDGFPGTVSWSGAALAVENRYLGN